MRKIFSHWSLEPGSVWSFVNTEPHSGKFEKLYEGHWWGIFLKQQQQQQQQQQQKCCITAHFWLFQTGSVKGQPHYAKNTSALFLTSYYQLVSDFWHFIPVIFNSTSSNILWECFSFITLLQTTKIALTCLHVIPARGWCSIDTYIHIRGSLMRSN